MLFLAELEQPVSRLKGIGPQAQQDLSQLGISNIGQLLRHYPIRYENRQDPKTLADTQDGEDCNTLIRVLSHDWIGHGYKRTLKVWVEDSSGQASLLCFGRNFLEKKLIPGEQFLLYGRIQIKFGERQCSSFELEKPSESPRNFGRILPIYPLSGKLQQKTLRNAMHQALNEWVLHIEEEIPLYIREKYTFPEQSEVIRSIHFPESIKEIQSARKALIFQEWYHLLLTSARRNLKVRKSRAHQLKPHLESLKPILDSLPFNLTPDQQKSLEDIEKDLSSPYPMNRLVQGEVGSGKTLVAFLSALMVINSGGQAVLMAPTELLARQHADNAIKLFPDHGIALLSGQTNQQNRQHIKEGLKEGTITLLIGTHAVFSQDIEFKSLDLVIVDEQHRFGVRQRLSLLEKGEHPHLLLMTATPIPRTLAITAYADLDISTIKTMPQGRKPIETHLAQRGKEKKVYDFVHGQLSQGRQAYFVYPLIEESEKLNLKDAESMFRYLSEVVFPGYKLALIHSRIEENQKKESMEAFVRGEIDILVATSVVEVGVDVPNATIMVIEQAERFGLSALHQLRGRVGRGEFASFTFLVYSANLTEEGKERLRTMKELSSGFDIARKDLEIRGAGDIAGFRQSGFMKLRIGQLERDQQVIALVRDEVMELLEKDPGLLDTENKVLRDLFQKAPPFSEDLVARG